MIVTFTPRPYFLFPTTSCWLDLNNNTENKNDNSINNSKNNNNKNKMKKINNNIIPEEAKEDTFSVSMSSENCLVVEKLEREL